MKTGYILATFTKLHPEILLDKEDLIKFGIYAAFFDSNGYVQIRYEGKQVYLHRAIMGFPDKSVDHVNQVKSDNRRVNLRLATTSQNRANITVRGDNTSGFKGVSWHKITKKWRADITVNKKQSYIGSYKTKEEAAKAYNRKALEIFGEFAALNEVP